MRGGRTYFRFDPPEELSTILRILSRSPEFLKSIGSTQDLDLCFFETALLTQNLGLQCHCVAQPVRVINSVRLGMFDVGVRVIEPALAGNQLRQEVMGPK